MNNTLGRGLSSLIPPKVKKQDASADGEIQVIETITPEDKDKILRISPAQIKELLKRLERFREWVLSILTR